MAFNVFFEIGIILLLATILGGLLRFLKQPLIIGYILTGILVSPYFFNFVGSTQTLELFSHIGIAFLLFIVGINLNPSMIKDVGKVSLITGLGQVLFTSIIGYFIGILLGFSVLTSLYIAVALTFSSTIIIMKLLTDKNDLDTLYGRISVGFLLVQDFVVIIILLFIATMGNGATLSEVLFKSLSSLIILTTGIFLFTKYILKNIIKFIAKSQEYLLLFSISWCFSLAMIFYAMDFSMEIGALLAGITLASTPYKFEISAKMKTLRDFFLILFFIVLGSQMVFEDISTYIMPIIIFSAFILIGNPLIVLIIMGFMGYTKKNSFLAGLTVAQISEFSLILVGMGVTVGHVSKEILSMVTVIGLITITGSTYLIMYSNKIYSKISKLLSLFERKGEKKDDFRGYTKKENEVILFGYDEIGFDILKSLHKLKRDFLVVDYNPEVIVNLSKQGFNCKYGDAQDLELLTELNLTKVNMVVSTISDTDTNLLLLKIIKPKNHNCIFIAVSHNIEQAIELYNNGTDYVILPHFLGGHYVSTMIENYIDKPQEFFKEKIKHLHYLNHRRVHKRHIHPKYEK